MKPSDTLSSAVRLRICGYLSGCEEADFKAVMEYCEISQSNLSRQLTTLEGEGLIDIRKVASGRYTKTRVRLTETGRTTLHEHVDWLRSLTENTQPRW